jgi:gliding motility-associated-like protein
VITPSTILCSGSTYTITAFGATNYSWNPFISSSNSLVVTPFSAGVTLYTVTGFSGPCSSSKTGTVTVNNTPIISAGATPTTICNGGQAILNATGATSYVWQPGNITGNNFPVFPSTNIVYTVTGTNNGCSGKNTIGINVNPSPALSVNISANNICSGSGATLVAGGAVTYTWQPGNSSNQAIIVSPNNTTTYTLSGTSSAGCSTLTLYTLTVNPTPTISAGASATSVCAGSPVTLSASGAATYTWNPGSLSGSSTIVTPTTNITYTVTGSNLNATCNSSQTVSIATLNNPTLTAQASASSICKGNSVILTASGGNSYTWTPGNHTGSSVTVTPGITTQYTVTGYNSSGCTGSGSINITVDPVPQISIFVSSATICSGNSTTLTASGAQNFVWSPGGTQTAGMVVSPGVTTNYTVTGTSGNCTDTETITLTVVQSPTITSGVSPAVCAGMPVQLTASGGVSYVWTPGNISGGSITVAPLITTQYSVTGASIAGCTSSAVLNVNVIPAPALIIAATARTLCPDQSATLTAHGATGYTWNASTPDSSIAITPIVTTTYTLTGINAAGCIATKTIIIDVVNCKTNFLGITLAAGTPILTNSNFYKIKFTVTASNSSSLDISEVMFYNDLSGTFAAPVTYTIISAPEVRSLHSQLYLDNAFDGASFKSLTRSTSTLTGTKRDTIEFSILVDPHGVYKTFQNSVTGTAKMFNGTIVTDSSNNGFQPDPDNDGDPTNNNDVTNIELLPISFFIPNGFSPNNDGLFDKFEIKGLEGRQVKLTVFNRWGNKVYEHPAYDNSWDGTPNVKGVSFGNGKLIQSTYYYVLQFTDGNKEARTGFIEIQY